MEERLSKAERKERTRADLLATARDEFAEKGFADAATNDVVGKTGLTRGALYHHFEDKQALFEAVYVNEQIRVLNTLQPGIERARTRDEAISAGIDAFLESMAERGTHRILLTDGPAVMGWTRWRELDSKYVLGAFERILSETRDKDDYAIPVPATVSKMVVSAMSEAVQLIAAAEDPEQARKEAKQIIGTMLSGFKNGSSAKVINGAEQKPDKPKKPGKPKKHGKGAGAKGGKGDGGKGEGGRPPKHDLKKSPSKKQRSK